MVIEVLGPNWHTVQVFKYARWTILGVGMLKKPWFDGIAGTEIRATCELLDVPRDEWPRITRLIHDLMVPVAQRTFNKALNRG